jgi:hypothetical protein
MIPPTERGAVCPPRPAASPPEDILANETEGKTLLALLIRGNIPRGCGGVKPPLRRSGPVPCQNLYRTLTRSPNLLKWLAWPIVPQWADRKVYPG